MLHVHNILKCRFICIIEPLCNELMVGVQNWHDSTTTWWRRMWFVRWLIYCGNIACIWELAFWLHTKLPKFVHGRKSSAFAASRSMLYGNCRKFSLKFIYLVSVPYVCQTKYKICPQTVIIVQANCSNSDKRCKHCRTLRVRKDFSSYKPKTWMWYSGVNSHSESKYLRHLIYAYCRTGFEMSANPTHRYRHYRQWLVG